MGNRSMAFDNRGCGKNHLVRCPMRFVVLAFFALLLGGCGSTWDYKLPHERCDPCDRCCQQEDR